MGAEVMTFKAKYHGDCAGGDHIYPGDMVMYDADSELLHENCASRETVTQATCSECNLIHAGECL